MFERLVVFVTIAALLACPLWCCDVRCLAAQCSLTESETAPRETCSAQRGGACCCGKSTSRDEDGDLPSEPAHPSCQGVCGGAVLAKPAESPTQLEMVWLPVIDSVGTIISTPTAPISRGAGVKFPGDGNYGRQLRTLHRSYLC